MKQKNISAYLVVLFMVLCLSSKAQQNMTILSYNVMHGFEGKEEKKAKFREWIAKPEIQPDVILLQELNGFTRAMIQDLALSMGYEYTALLNKETGLDPTHPLGIISRYPLKNVTYQLDTMWHGYIYAQIKNLHVFVTHLAPFTRQHRINDIKRIVGHAISLEKDANVIIAGDLNSFARVDSVHYGEKLLKSMLTLEGRLEPKSGTPIVKNRVIYRNNLLNDELDFSITDQILQAGFKDVYFDFHKCFKNSVPVRPNLKESSVLRRIDFIWSSENLFKLVNKIDIIQDNYTDHLSDHYPLLMNIRI